MCSPSGVHAAPDVEEVVDPGQKPSVSRIGCGALGYADESTFQGGAMKIGLVVLTLGILASPAVHAQSGPEVLKARGCLNCHEADRKKVGPAFKDIAAKHKGNKDAAGALVAKIKEGKGHPKNPAAEAELRAAVDHILGH
jgi:cytochrome c551/c552